MLKRSFSSLIALIAVIVIVALAGCRPAQETDGPGAGNTALPSTPSSTEPLPTQLVQSTIPAQQLVESTIPAQPSPTASATLAATPEETVAATPTSPATATRPATAASTAPASTRATPGVVVTSEPRVDVWTYGTGVVSAQIEGPLQATIGFLNSLIADGSGNSSLAYLDPGLRAEAVANTNNDLVLGIDVAYTSFEVNWLGTSGATSQVEGILIYEGGAQAAHRFDLRLSGDAWQIVRVAGDS